MADSYSGDGDLRAQFEDLYARSKPCPGCGTTHCTERAEMLAHELRAREGTIRDLRVVAQAYRDSGEVARRLLAILVHQIEDFWNHVEPCAQAAPDDGDYPAEECTCGPDILTECLRYLAGVPPDRRNEQTVRSWARRHGELDGADAAALEHAISMTEIERDSARKLLVEWRSTPFFGTRLEWEEWVADFGRRVDAQIGDKP